MKKSIETRAKIGATMRAWHAANADRHLIRDNGIRKMRRSGMTLEAIAEKVGLTSARVGQIIREWAVSTTKKLEM